MHCGAELCYRSEARTRCLFSRPYSFRFVEQCWLNRYTVNRHRMFDVGLHSSRDDCSMLCNAEVYLFRIFRRSFEPIRIIESTGVNSGHIWKSFPSDE